MFTFLSVCRHVVCRKPFGVRCVVGYVPSPKEPIPRSHLTVFVPDPEKGDIVRQGVNLANQYLDSVSGEVDWNDMMKALHKRNVQNPANKIFQACLRRKDFNTGMNYYNYLVKNNIKLSTVDLMFFCKLLAMNKKEIPNYEELLVQLYDEIKDFIRSSVMIRSFLMEVMVEVPSIFLDIVKRGICEDSKGGYLFVVYKALELNMWDVAKKFMMDPDFDPEPAFIDCYLRYCTENAKRGTFSNQLINNVIDLCAARTVCWNHENLLTPLKDLVSALNEHQDEYQWSVHHTTLKNNHVCSSCGSTLRPNGITMEEFKKLQEHLFQQAFNDSKIYLNSTRAELQKFLKFLETTEPFTVVIDGLNIMYIVKKKIVHPNMCTLKQLFTKGKQVLTIARHHIKGEFKKLFHLSGNKEMCQFFFTSNMSEDDLFVLYAAMYGGPNTFFVTGDLMGSHLACLPVEMRSIFLKWQLSHQYLIQPDMSILVPVNHCKLPQLTVSDKKKKIWHISSQPLSCKRFALNQPVHWFCLKTEKKASSTD